MQQFHPQIASYVADPDPQTSSPILPYATPEAHDGRHPVLGIFLILMGLGFGLFGGVMFLIGVIGIFGGTLKGEMNFSGRLFFFIAILLIAFTSIVVCVYLCRSARDIIRGKST